MTIIDVHTHMFTEKWLELLKTRGGEFNLQTRPDGKMEIFRGKTPVVIPQVGHFDYELRIREMDRFGIDMSVVSLTCPNVYWGDEATSTLAARESNDAMQAAQARWPDRLRWFTSLPWEYPQSAIQELERSLANGAVGVMVLGNIAGKSLTDPLFEPVWQAIDAHALPVLVHPTDPLGAEAMGIAPHNLFWSVGFTYDTTLAVAKMIFSGFFDRHPRLKLIASHGGGMLPYLVGRFEMGDKVEFDHLREMKRKPTDYLRHIYYDSITYDLAPLRYLIEVAGASQVMLGTDWPHRVHEADVAVSRLQQLPDAQRRAIASENARRVFGL
jgi:aminocarboxymuconate-semialdehyde decarboxylase